MSAREFKPGDVAMVTWSAMGELRTDIRFRCYRKALGGHVWESPDGTWIGDATAKKVRPLIGIDPEDREQVKRLFDAYCTTVNRNRVDAMQAALRSLIALQKPEEPTGWGAVVEDNTGAYWTLFAPEAGVWINYREGKRHYHSIPAVRVVHEGVTA